MHLLLVNLELDNIKYRQFGRDGSCNSVPVEYYVFQIFQSTKLRWDRCSGVFWVSILESAHVASGTRNTPPLVARIIPFPTCKQRLILNRISKL